METPDPKYYNNPTSNSFPPKSWLIEYILATVFCCLPLGIVGIINAASVEGKYANGDVAGANRAAQTAKTMVIISVVAGLAGAISYLVFFGGMALFYGANS